MRTDGSLPNCRSRRRNVLSRLRRTTKTCVGCCASCVMFSVQARLRKISAAEKPGPLGRRIEQHACHQLSDLRNYWNASNLADLTRAEELRPTRLMLQNPTRLAIPLSAQVLRLIRLTVEITRNEQKFSARHTTVDGHQSPVDSRPFVMVVFTSVSQIFGSSASSICRSASPPRARDLPHARPLTLARR